MGGRQEAFIDMTMRHFIDKSVMDGQHPHVVYCEKCGLTVGRRPGVSVSNGASPMPYCHARWTPTGSRPNYLAWPWRDTRRPVHQERPLVTPDSAVCLIDGRSCAITPRDMSTDLAHAYD